MKRVTPSFLVLSWGIALLSWSDVRAATTTYNFSRASGDWNLSTNWSPNGTPVAGDNVNINSGNDAIVDSADGTISGLQVANSSPSGTLTIAAGGSLGTTGFTTFGGKSGATGNLVMTGGAFTASAGLTLGFASGSAGTTAISGGTFSSAGAINVGSGSSTGSIFGVSGGTVNWSGGSSGSGFNISSGNAVTITGSSAILAYNGTGNNIQSFITNAGSSLNFVFDSAGVSAIDLHGTALTIFSGSLLTIDGSSYSGGSADITLFEGLSSYKNGIGTTFSSSITGFGAGYTESLVYNAGSIVLEVTQVPEPEVLALELFGFGFIALAVGKRFRVRLR